MSHSSFTPVRGPDKSAGRMSPDEIAAVGFLAAVAAFVLLREGRGASRTRWLVLGVLMLFFVAAATPLITRTKTLAAPSKPRATTRGEYLSSNACRSCHPSEYASWHQSYHRRMTQDATVENAAAPLDGRSLALDKRTLRLTTRGSEIWATLPDPDMVADAALQNRLAENAPDVERRVTLLTGSHHEQAFWVAGRRPGELRLFPFVWMIAEKRFVPRKDAFLQPPDAVTGALRWNSNCIGCHAVGGQPGHDIDRDAFDTNVVELGIACEACHGPGGAHVRRHQDPLERYTQTGKGGDPTIKNPKNLDPEAASAICGQCHSYAFPRDEDDWWSHGYALSYRPGQTLDRSRALFSLSTVDDPAAPRVDAATESLFWSDGAIRVGGREYNGLVESSCYQRGHGERKMTCLSCHSLHKGDPDDQLDPVRSVDDACVSCHQAERGRAHSHHIDGSSGHSCANCHTPQTTYALFKAIRSHRIDSPNIATTLQTGRPNACNLCHLDRSLGWTQGYLASWYGQANVDLPAEHKNTAAMAIHALRGDAAVRVISAAAFGWAPAVAVSPHSSSVQVLAELLVDPYAAVRFVAARSLRSQPGYEDLDYDFLAPPAAREEARQAIRLRLTASGTLPEGFLDELTVRALQSARDNRPVTIAE